MGAAFNQNLCRARPIWLGTQRKGRAGRLHGRQPFQLGSNKQATKRACICATLSPLEGGADSTRAAPASAWKPNRAAASAAPGSRRKPPEEGQPAALPMPACSEGKIDE